MARNKDSAGRSFYLRVRLVGAFLTFFVVLQLSGCSGFGLGDPEYVRPEVPKKQSWSRASAGVTASEVIRPDWWTGFGDDYLNTLVEQAVSENINLRILADRLDVARSNIEQAEAGALPTILAAGGIDYTKSTGVPSTTQYSLAGSVDWEIDIWGKFARGVEAQEAELYATEADWRAGYLTLVSDVAVTYFNIRLADEQIESQKRSIASNKRVMRIYKRRHEEGISPKTQYMQQRAEVKRLQNGLVELKRRRAVAENSLATLIGKPSGDYKVPTAYLRECINIIDVPVGLPSELLSRRPDVIASEYRLLSAHNLAIQSRLARLPTIALTGRLGTASFELADLMKAFTYGFSPSITFPVFDPQVLARVKFSEAQAKVATDQYRAVILGAFEETENALVNLASHKEQLVLLQQRLDDLEAVARQLRRQLDEGLISKLEVFEIERSLLVAELELLADYQQILFDIVTLYKTLGGGWPVERVGQTGE